MKDEAKECFQVGKGCFQVAWHCTQFWTTLSISAIVIWLVYRPYYFHPNVDSAVLNTLNLTTNSTGLQYDLAVDMSFHNSGTSTSGPPPSMVEPSSAPPTTPSRHPSAKDQKTQPCCIRRSRARLLPWTPAWQRSWRGSSPQGRCTSG
ncbi:unnamed protein product [Urochloa decumbens]|uniref:Uncharacterized protein n=1 Tax=Urochloa decumbens TaxID=240449 RepID=A0ABC9AZL5_9POAL